MRSSEIVFFSSSSIQSLKSNEFLLSRLHRPNMRCCSSLFSSLRALFHSWSSVRRAFISD